MPNIPTFQESIGRLPVSSGGEEARVMEGRHIAAEYNEAGQRAGGALAKVGGQIGNELDKRQAQEQILKGHADLSEIDAGFLKQWSDKTKDPNFDPNDQSVAQDFQERHDAAVNEYLQHVSNSHASEHLTGAADQFNQNFKNHIAGQQASIAGDMDVANLNKLVNNSGAIVANDPHLLESEFDRVKTANDAYAATHSAVNADTAAKLHTAVEDQAGNQLGMTAAKAMIDRDPVGGLKEVNSNKFMADHLKPEQREQLGKYAENIQKINDEHDKSVAVEQRRQNVSSANQTAIQGMNDGMNSDGSLNGAVIRDTMHKLSGMPDVPEGLVRSMFEMQKVANEDAARGFKVKTDQPVFNNLVNKMYDTDKPTQLKDVFQAQADRKLNTADAAEMREQIHARDTNPRNPFENDSITSTRKAAFASLNPFGTQSGYLAVQKFEYSFNQQYQHSSPEQRDKMLDPSSPTYVLSPSNLAKFKGSSISDTIEAPPPAGTPKKSLSDLMQQHFGEE